MSTTPSEVSVWKAQVAAGAGILFFSLLAGTLFAIGLALVAVLMVPLVVLSAYLLLVYGPIRSDESAIWMEGSLETVGMAWAEVKQIRFGRFQLVLEGGEKRLVLPKPWFWAGPGRTAVLAYIKMLANDYLPPPPKSRTADLVLSRNVQRITPTTLK